MKGLSKSFLSREHHALFVFWILVAVVVAVAVRWYGLATQSLWVDEGYSLWLSRYSVREIWRLVQADTSPPLYYWLLHFWTQLFGISEISLRGMSAFFATLSIFFFFVVAKRILQNKAGLWALWLFAVCIIQVRYAKDARFYSALSFFSIASLYFLIEFLDQRSTMSFAGLVATLAAGLYTHNMMLFYLPGLSLTWLLYPSRQTPLQRVKDGLLCGILLLLIYLPWFPVLVSQTKMVAASLWIPKPGLWVFAETVCRLCGLDIIYLSRGFYRILPWVFQNRWSCMLALLLPLATCVGVAFWRVSPEDRQKGAALLGYALCPILMAFFYSFLTTSIFLERTFIASSAVLLILITGSIAYQTGRSRRFSEALVMIILLGSVLSLRGFFKHYRAEDWRGMTAYLMHLPQQKRLIVFFTQNGPVLFDYYVARNSYPHKLEAAQVLTFDDPGELRPTNYSQRSLNVIKQTADFGNFEEVDIVLSHAPPQFSELLPGYVQEKCTSSARTTFYGIELVRCMSQMLPKPQYP